MSSIYKFFYFLTEFNSSLLESKSLDASSSSANDSAENEDWTSYVVTIWQYGEKFKRRVFCMASIGEGQILLTTLFKAKIIDFAMACNKAFPGNTIYPQFFAHIQHINNKTLKETISIKSGLYFPVLETMLNKRTEPRYKKLAVLIVSH